MRFLPLLFLLSGCSIGLSAHSVKLDKPEVQLDTLLGIVRVEKGSFFCEHLSAINQTEQGGGLNHCGVLVEITGF